MRNTGITHISTGMRQETQNTKVVQDAYAAFTRGDVQALLGCFADDIVWTAVYGTGSLVPTSGVRRGKAAVAEFFRQVAANVNFSTFEPKQFVAAGDKVVALGHYTATTPIGKSFEGILRWCSQWATARSCGSRNSATAPASTRRMPRPENSESRRRDPERVGWRLPSCQLPPQSKDGRSVSSRHSR